MRLLLFAFSHYRVVAIFCFVAYVIGRALLPSLTFSSWAENFSLSTAFGLGLLSQGILVVGLFGWLTATGVTVLLGILVVGALFFHWWRRGRFSFRSFEWNRRTVGLGLIFLGLGILLVPILLLPLYPPTDFDETMYHLAVVKVWLSHHRIVPTPYLRGQVLPHTAHALFAALMALKDDRAAQALSTAVTLLTAIGLFGWATRLRNSAAGLFAAALWLGSPAVLAQSGVASYHELAALFCMGALYSLTNYLTERKVAWLFLSAAFIGFAQSTWSITIFLIPVFGFAAIYFAVRERSLFPVALMIAGTLVGWGPAMARSYYYTGNPAYPLLASIFGPGPWWNMNDLAGMMADVHRFGVGRNLHSLLILPYSLYFLPEKFQSTEAYSCALFLVLPFVALATVFRPTLRWLGLIAFYYVTCWFVLAQVMRYLLPIIPLFCVLTAVATFVWLDILLHWNNRTALYLTIVPALAILFPGWLFAERKIKTDGPIPITRKQVAHYLSRSMPSYPAIAAANASPGTIYDLFGANSAYYADGLFIGDWFGPGRYSYVLEAMRDGKGLYRQLHHFGAKYFLLDRSAGPNVALPYDDPAFQEHFQLIFSNASTDLYRLSDIALPVRNKVRNLLRNPGFDRLNDGWPVGWDHNGTPVIGTPPEGAASGVVAVKVTPSDLLQQTVNVRAGQSYTLALKATQATPGALFRLQVNWVDSNGNVCGTFIRVFEAEKGWKSYSAPMIAPPCAQTALVYACGHAGGAVWLDSFSFESAESGSGDRAPSTSPTR